MSERNTLGGRARRAAKLAKLGAKAGAGLVSTRRAERRGDEDAADAGHEAIADAVFETLGSMKGAAMKLGQMMAFVDFDVPDDTSDIYRKRLNALLDQAPATDTDAIEESVAEQYGAAPEDVFARWDREPIAVASIGQVHRAELPDGTEVAVKVQHPGIAEAIQADLGNMSVLRPLFNLTHPNLDTKPLIDEVRERLRDELDYQKEAAYQQAFYDRFEGHPSIQIPQVFHDWCRPRVLVSAYVEGRTFEDVLENDPKEARDYYGESIFRFVFSSLYRFRIFNADPHPGNFIFPEPGSADGYGKVTFIDFGSARTFSSETRSKLRALHLAVAADNEGDPSGSAALERAMSDAGLLPEDRRGIDFDVVRRWFSLAYEPLAGDREWTYSTEYSRRLIAASTDPTQGMEATLRRLTMPAEYILLNRIQFGVNSLLARLQPTANWQRIMEEIATSGPPTTPLGEAEQAWLGEVNELVEPLAS
ncbi:ABC1 kinase family protein [Euzebya tangerina]|uniref:ABC1 kinase family protein n=1 Tax=Euzebya tangerina TaxID=591198 RepID=UPI000E31BE79|nr:AarF/ABC1/UbiB kinase family protein [Euzebya tangerina]